MQINANVESMLYRIGKQCVVWLTSIFATFAIFCSILLSEVEDKLEQIGVFMHGCHVHAVTHLLTFNVAHITRLAAFGPGVTIVDPKILRSNGDGSIAVDAPKSHNFGYFADLRWPRCLWYLSRSLGTKRNRIRHVSFGETDPRGRQRFS